MQFSDWKYVPFKELFSWAKKSTIKSGEGKSDGKYKMFICSDTQVKHYDSFLENCPSLIFGTGGKASCHFANEPFAYSTDCAVAQAKTMSMNLKFYYYYLRKNCLSELQNTFTGSGLQHTSKTKIDKITVPFPPFDEQQHIVNRIEELFSSLDNAVDTLQKVEKQLAVYRQAVLKAAFEGLETRNQREITDLCTNIVDCPHSTPKWVSKGRLCLRTTNFRRGYLDLSEKNYVSEQTFNERIVRLRPKAGDVLFSREGAILGLACIIPDGLDVCMGQRMMLLRPSVEMNNRYLMHYLNSPISRQLIIEKVGGSASPHINVGDIKKFKIPYISRKKQEELVFLIDANLSVCDSIEQTVETTLQQAEAMRQSILKEAFEGRLA